MKQILTRGWWLAKSPIITAISLLALGRRLEGHRSGSICQQGARAVPHELNSGENGDHGDNQF